MPKKIDLTGERFGKWTVLEDAGRAKNRHILWRCVCDCGNETVTEGAALRGGKTTGCGKGECSAHHDPTRKGAAHREWKGDAITYPTAHRRAESRYGKASGHVCVDCDAPADDWSLDQPYADDPRDGKGRPYSPDPSRYVARCRSCHRSWDNALTRSRQAVAAGLI
ncbi:hypothetical protein ABZ767_18470 [Streptomyces pseudogriseolus]|uniref:hypothetical protein n=1 Tax=Streptomyces pseudogriseolus TaxID=36817 RepID=UPI00349B234C